MSNKRKMTSWERRRRRRMTITVILTVILFIVAAVVIILYSRMPYQTIRLSKYCVVGYSGYNTKGTAEITLDMERLSDVVEDARIDYEEAIIQWDDIEVSEYDDFLDSITFTTDIEGYLSNGSEFNIYFDYDKELAEKLMIDVIGDTKNISVSGLVTATVLTKEDLFRDIEVSFSGISPNITAEITNNSNNSFIKNMVFSPEEFKELYKTGDVIRLRAYFSEDECLKQNYAIESPSEECVVEYVVGNTDSYLTDSARIDGAILEEAIAAGKQAFNNANEYGVRIFCEANLVPVYINKQATFKWLTPSLISAYFKVANEGVGGVNGYHYNDLDLVYKCQITQADGVTCSAEGVVRFSDFIVRSDGSIEYDFSEPRLISADYNNSSIVKTVKTMYEDTYEIYKLR